MFLELILCFIVLAVLKLLFCKSRVSKMLKNIPGPKPHPIIGNIFEFDYPKIEITETFKKLSFQYGPVCLVWMGTEPLVCLRDPQDIEILLSSSVDLNKASVLYWVMEPWLNQGLLMSTAVIWKRHRKILTPAFHFKILEQFVPIFVKKSKILIEKLENKSGIVFDVTSYISLCSLDILSETTMGLEVNCQLHESEYVKALNELQEIMGHRNYDFMKRNYLFNFTRSGRRHNELIDYLHNFTNNVIKERKCMLEKSDLFDSNTEEKKDYLDAYLGYKKKKVFLDILLRPDKEEDRLTDSEIREQVDTFMFEGYDTTTNSISFCLYSLSQNAHVQELAYEELNGIFGGDDRDCTYQDLMDMKYLDKVIKETLRLHTLVPIIGRKIRTDMQLNSNQL